MSETELRLHGGTLQLPPGWAEITAELGDSSLPTTIVKFPEELGILQVSIHLFVSGPRPDFGSSELDIMLLSDLRGSGIDRIGEPQFLRGRNTTVHRDSVRGSWFVRTWLTARDGNIAKFTYLCPMGDEGSELDECNQIVRSLRFP